MRLLGAVAAALLLVAVPASAATSVRATLLTSSLTPVVDRPWRYTVTVRSATGQPIRARMRLQVLLGETVVGCWKGRAMVQCLDGSLGSWIAFRGRRTGVLRWPPDSVGPRLVFRAVVQAAGRTLRLRLPVTVQPVR